MPVPTSESHLLRETVEAISNRVPTGWTLEPDAVTDSAVDAQYVLSAPDGRQVMVIIEVKAGAPVGRQAVGVAQRLHERAVAEHAVPLLVARYLAPPVRDELQRIGVSYADVTGNLMLSAINPGIFISDRGQDRDPARVLGRPRGTLKGDPAALVVRTLLDYSRSWKVRDLIAESGASTGATYRVLDYLDGEGLADRVEGQWSVPSWEKLLRAWARDYSFLSENSTTRFLDPRGVDHFLGRLQDDSDTYAVTGAVASRVWASVAPVRAVFVYVADADKAASRWSIRATEAGANVVLLEPRSSTPVAFQRSRQIAGGLWSVATAQAAVDLLNGPGRDPQQAEELIDWMRTNEHDWRLA